ncbi:hypothetical protein K457DRAFT_131984 [Linnemannia elongata AG-77]|uniref:Uncharacterized protein n=1 Tax=Linnemannia elongata AG-77 TaxID=1314771 RepID=A0A197KH45_9FUNG|nr:hypothetical protein K457DRAFT_131984 [Linnemannia elongata AG-77]
MDEMAISGKSPRDVLAPRAAIQYSSERRRNCSHFHPQTTILIQLQKLGLLLDVELMVKELDSQNFRPMPSLERLSLGGEVAEHPDRILNRLFPKPPFSRRLRLN